MAINLDDKKAIVAEVQEAASGAHSVVIADARGVTFQVITQVLLLVYSQTSLKLTKLLN